MRYSVYMDHGIQMSEHRTMERAERAQEAEVSRQRQHLEKHAQPDDRVVQGRCASECLPDNVAGCTTIVLYSPHEAMDDILVEKHVYIIVDDVN